MNADFAAGAVLISFGAVLGVLSPFQLLVMALLEVVVYALNEWVLADILEVRADPNKTLIRLKFYTFSIDQRHWRVSNYPHIWRVFRSCGLVNAMAKRSER